MIITYPDGSQSSGGKKINKGKQNIAQPLKLKLEFLKNFIGKSQLACISDGLRGEESQYFIELVEKLTKTIKEMPQTYQQDGKGDKAIAHLHYFQGGFDWYITEKDKGDGSDDKCQYQAFGLASMHEIELGYISIQEMIECNVELDFHFKPIDLAEIKKKLKK